MTSATNVTVLDTGPETAPVTAMVVVAVVVVVVDMDVVGVVMVAPGMVEEDGGIDHPEDLDPDLVIAAGGEADPRIGAAAAYPGAGVALQDKTPNLLTEVVPGAVVLRKVNIPSSCVLLAGLVTSSKLQKMCVFGPILTGELKCTTSSEQHIQCG